MSSLASITNPLTREEVDLRVDVLRAIWILAACRQNDAVAAALADLGIRLIATRRNDDWETCRAIIAETRQWLSTFGGVVTSRMTTFFERIADVESDPTLRPG